MGIFTKGLSSGRRFRLTHFAFYPTSDWWFWVENEPPWSLETPPDAAVRAAFSKTVVWEEDRDFARIGVCADGLIFASFQKEDESDLAANLYHLNALNLLFVSALRREARIDAGLEWISRTSRIRGYQTEKGFGGSGNTLSRNWAGLMSRRWSGDLPPEWFMMRRQIGLGVIESWAATVDETFHSTVRVRLLAEYALALSLFHDHNFSGALTHSWFVSEHLFSAKWQGLFPTKGSSHNKLNI